MRFSTYTPIIFLYFFTKFKMFCSYSTNKISNNLNIVVQDGIILPLQPFDTIFSTMGLLTAEMQVIL